MCMRIGVFVYGLVAGAFIFGVPSAYASTSSGIDTPQGVTSLPLAIEGQQGMELSKQSNEDIYVSVGTTSAPVAPLDVNGGMRGSNSSIVAGGACSPEGMLGYDLTHHEPVYCNSSGAWTANGSPHTYTPLWCRRLAWRMCAHRTLPGGRICRGGRRRLRQCSAWQFRHDKFDGTRGCGNRASHRPHILANMLCHRLPRKSHYVGLRRLHDPVKY